MTQASETFSCRRFRKLPALRKARHAKNAAASDTTEAPKNGSPGRCVSLSAAMDQEKSAVQSRGARMPAMLVMLFSAPWTAPCSSAGTAFEIIEWVAGEPMPAMEPMKMITYTIHPSVAAP